MSSNRTMCNQVGDQDELSIRSARLLSLSMVLSHATEASVCSIHQPSISWCLSEFRQQSQHRSHDIPHPATLFRSYGHSQDSWEIISLQEVLGLSWAPLLVQHAQNTSPRRCTEDILVRFLNHLNCVDEQQLLSPSWMTELLTLWLGCGWALFLHLYSQPHSFIH